MKKTIISLLLFAFCPLSAMEVEDDTSFHCLYSKLLPAEIDAEIMSYVLQEPFKLNPEDAIQDIAEYDYPLKEHITQLKVSSDGKQIVLGKYGKMMSVESGEIFIPFKVESSFGLLHAVSSNGNWAVVGDLGKVCIVTKEDRQRLEYDQDGFVGSAAVSSKGDRVASCSMQGAVKIVNVASEDAITECEFNVKGANSVAWYPDGERIVVGGPYILQTLNIENGEAIAQYEKYEDGLIGPIAVFPDGKRLLFGEGKKVNIFDVDRKEKREVYKHDKYKVDSIDVSSDGKLILSGGSDGMVKIAEAERGTVLAEYAHYSNVQAALFPDGCRIVSADFNKIRIRSIVPLLLSQFTLPAETTFAHYLLLKRVQENLLTKKEPLLIGQLDRDTLDEMEPLKKLLKIEKSQSKTKNPIWRLQMKYTPKAAPQNCVIV